MLLVSLGPRIIKWILKSLVKSAQKDLDEKSRQFYEQTENGSPFQESIYTEDDIKVIVKKNVEKEKRPLDLGAEEVDFEEI